MTYYLKKHWPINTLVVVLQILCAGISVVLNLVLIQATQGIFDFDMITFLKWMAVDCTLWVVYCVTDGCRIWAISKAKKTMNNHVRADMVASMLKQNHKEFHSQQSGEYISWFINDVNQISGLAWDPFYNIIEKIAAVVFSIFALAQMHWSLLVASLFVALIIINAPKLFTKRVEKLSEECAKKQAQAMAKMKDLLAGLDVLKSFGRTSRFIEGNWEVSEELEQPKHKQTYMQAFIGEGINFVNIICQISVNILIGVMSIKGIIIQSALLGGGNLCGTIYGGLASLSRQILSIRASMPYFRKIPYHAEDLTQHIGLDCGTSCKAISMKNVSFAYGDKQILKEQSMEFEKGGKYALTGPSGCGKSTVLKILLGWLPDYQGTIRFDNKNAREFSQEELLQQMSYIEQDVFLFNTTIRDNITLGADFTDEMLGRAIRGSALDGDLATMPLGLDTPVGENGNNLSGGQKQRVAIARALIHNRSILLVDEGTSALDQKNADIVEQSLLSNPDLTLILVSHHLTEERKAQFTKVYELEPVAAITEEARNLGAVDVF